MNNTIPFPGGDRLPDPSEAGKEKLVYDERGMVDLPFLLITILLVFIGVIVMFSASYARAYTEGKGSTYYFSRQGGFALVGIVIMMVVSRLNYQMWRALSIPILGATAILMFITPFFGLTGGGATRWINLGIVSFQPSEVAKIAVILSFAAMISQMGEKIKSFKNLVPFAIILGFLVLTLILQRHLSAIVIICCLGAAMLFMGGAQLRWFALGFCAAALFGYLYIANMGYAADRLTAWQNPELDPRDKGLQILQSLYAIGSGGLMGLGLGRSRQKYLYLPEEHNDYIFPIACEELGFVGAVVIVLLFMLLILRGYWIAMHARDRFGALMVGGISTLLALQVFFNIGVVTNLLPATGISLPFFSYGGTALVIQLFEMGLVLSVSRQCNNQLLM